MDRRTADALDHWITHDHRDYTDPDDRVMCDVCNDPIGAGEQPEVAADGRLRCAECARRDGLLVSEDGRSER